MSTETVLDRIHTTYDQIIEKYEHDQQQAVRLFQEATKHELVNSSVIANYGTKKTYIIKDVAFDKNPCSTFFTNADGKPMSVAKYFLSQYKMKITDKNQPMLIANQNGREISLIPEFCLLDGVPDSIRNNSRSMRTLLNKVK